MPKWLTVVIVAVLAIALVGGGAAYAAYRVDRAEASRAAWSGGWPMGMRGFAGPMMSGRGSGFAGPMMGGYGGVFAGGAMHDYVFSAQADTLGLSVEDLTARLQDGESIADIAESQGLSLDELADAHKAAFEQALQAAVEAGELTQEQADWILDHHAAGRFVLGAGPMGFMGGRGFMHGWSGPRGWGEFGEVPAP